MIIQNILLTIFEFSLFAAIILGVIYEKQLIKLEKMLFKKLKNLWEVIR